MPHNICSFNEEIHVLNSLKGELLFNNASIQGVFPAFARGLDFDGSYYFIGQSKIEIILRMLVYQKYFN